MATAQRGRSRKKVSCPKRAVSRTLKWPKRSKRNGYGVIVALEEDADGISDRVSHSIVFEDTKSHPKGGKRGAPLRLASHVIDAAAAVGHAQRAKVLAKLLKGPATYRTLQKTTSLKAGPMYHHVNQLRLAGLVMPKQRDLYELTRAGRNLILTLAALGPLVKDRRRRPLGTRES